MPGDITGSGTYCRRERLGETCGETLGETCCDQHASPGIALVRGHFPEYGVERAAQLVDGARDGLVDVGCMVRDGGWLTACNSRFDDASLVVGAVLVTVLVAEMYFNTRQALRETGDTVPQ